MPDQTPPSGQDTNGFMQEQPAVPSQADAMPAQNPESSTPQYWTVPAMPPEPTEPMTSETTQSASPVFTEAPTETLPEPTIPTPATNAASTELFAEQEPSPTMATENTEPILSPSEETMPPSEPEVAPPELPETSAAEPDMLDKQQKQESDDDEQGEQHPYLVTIAAIGIIILIIVLLWQLLRKPATHPAPTTPVEISSSSSSLSSSSSSGLSDTMLQRILRRLANRPQQIIAPGPATQTTVVQQVSTSSVDEQSIINRILNLLHGAPTSSARSSSSSSDGRGRRPATTFPPGDVRNYGTGDQNTTQNGNTTNTYNTYNTYGGSGSIGTFLGVTPDTYTGKIEFGGKTGYEAANAACVGTYGALAHLCHNMEIVNTINGGNIATLFNAIPDAWIVMGPPGYTANSNDCRGWTSDADTNLGPYWHFDTANGGIGFLVNCSVSNYLSCCR